ncbi:MAG: hypothetical protein J7497_12035, partial [Chitinophagaceae bacterium]|nr:hypothetical protein [Chitinophagaceae bacterium]
ISVDAKQMPLTDFLAVILKDLPLTYSILNTTISIKEKSPTGGLNPGLQEHHFSDALPPPITGVIRDAEGNPLGGINIVIKGTKRGVVSDA